MIKRRFANSIEGDFHLKYLEDKIFKGYVCYNKLKCDEPLFVNDGIKNLCVRDNNYTWILAYPSESNYSLTIIFDDKMNLVEWYFDIAKEVGVENGVPYEDDLFLDMIITSDEKVSVVDEDELLDAKQKGIITDKDVELAYSTLKFLKKKYGVHIDDLKTLTKHFCNQFKLKYYF